MYTYLAAFDLDHTLVQGNISFHFGFYLFRHGQMRLGEMLFNTCTYFRHKFLGMPFREMHEKIFQHYFKGRSLQELQTHVEQFLTDRLEQLLYPPAWQALQAAVQSGHLVAILSNSPAFLVTAIAHRLGAQEALGTDYATDAFGNFEHVGQCVEAPDKVAYLQQLCAKFQISPIATAAYSDSFHDRQFLEAVETPVAVRPDRKLRLLAIKKRWRII